MTRNKLALIVCCLVAPTVAFAQTGGLSKVQLLGLQQQLKEECGLQHATGVMDGPTRHAIAVCNKKYGTEGSGAALLQAMNIGFSVGDNTNGMGMLMSNEGNASSNGSMSASDHGSMTNNGHGTNMDHAASRSSASRRATATGTSVSHARNNELTPAKSGPCAGLRPVDRDAAAHPVDSTSGTVDVDNTTNDRAVAAAAAKGAAGTGDKCTTDQIRKAVPPIKH